MILVIWDLEDDPQGNTQHIAEHGVTPEEVEEVLERLACRTTYSASSGRPITFGWTTTGRYLAVVWEVADEEPLDCFIRHRLSSSQTEPGELTMSESESIERSNGRPTNSGD